MKFITNQLILEGPDLSGKTTLYYDIHKATGYKWNIQDRSSLSMLIFAKFYNRDTFTYVETLRSELYNLNNRYVILLPDWATISKRYSERGDELHDLISLKRSYDFFEEAVSEFGDYPNVMIARNADCLQDVVQNVANLEMSSLKQIQSQILQLASASDNKEAVGVNFTVYDSGKFEQIDYEALNYEPEKKYYAGIKLKVMSKIVNERKGKNEYKRKEPRESRRFIYTDDTCISLAQFNFRKDCLDCHFVLRSSNVRDTLYYDLNFLYSLCKDVHNALKLDDNIFCRMRFTINSAHIPVIINDKEQDES
jgi:hypothetical protein